MTTARLSRRRYGPRVSHEEREQAVLAQYLDRLGVHWFHTPNETKATPQYLGKRARLGVKPGVPDVLITTPPPCGGYVGAAIELKSTLPSARVSESQREWIAKLETDRWAARVCRGAGEAIEFVRELGYERQPA